MKKIIFISLIILGTYKLWAVGITGPAPIPECNTNNVTYLVNVAVSSAQWTVSGGYIVQNNIQTIVVQPSTNNTINVSCNFIVAATGQPGSASTSTPRVPIAISNITGAESLCKYPTGTYQEAYTVTQVSGATYQWSVTSNLSIISGQGTNTVVVRGTNSGTGTLSVVVNCCSGVTKNKSKSITICGAIPAKPPYFTHSWPGLHYEGEIKQYYIPTVPNVTGYQWQKANLSDPIKIISQTISDPDIEASGTGTFFINTRLKNPCGYGPWRYGTTDNQYVEIYDPNKSSSSGITDETNGEENIKIYPNPACDEITINIPDILEINEVLFYDLCGKEVLRLSISGKKNTLNISSLPKGLYFLLLQGENIAYKEKINVIR